ncbi:hypothetical protein H4R34_002136, partial [Dimargaris verticillata]
MKLSILSSLVALAATEFACALGNHGAIGMNSLVKRGAIPEEDMSLIEDIRKKALIALQHKRPEMFGTPSSSLEPSTEMKWSSPNVVREFFGT